MTLDPALEALLAGCFALLFASAALHKLLDLPRFAAVLEAYQLFPVPLARLAWVVPMLELALALGLLAGVLRPVAALAGAALLALYAGAIAINLRRGRFDLTCGCGAAGERRAIAPWMLWRNLALAGLLCAAALPLKARPLLTTDYLTVSAGVAVAALLYASVDRILGQLQPRAQLMRGAS
jgi:uncharacterized membrane protein YphA (DoxX/SURF4 family)